MSSNDKSFLFRLLVAGPKLTVSESLNEPKRAYRGPQFPLYQVVALRAAGGRN